MADHCHWNALTSLIFAKWVYCQVWTMGDISMNMHQPNSGDTQTVLITHQESPSDLSGPTIDGSMPSGKETSRKKSRFSCH